MGDDDFSFGAAVEHGRFGHQLVALFFGQMTFKFFGFFLLFLFLEGFKGVSQFGEVGVAQKIGFDPDIRFFQGFKVREIFADLVEVLGHDRFAVVFVFQHLFDQPARDLWVTGLVVLDRVDFAQHSGHDRPFSFSPYFKGRRLG